MKTNNSQLNVGITAVGQAFPERRITNQDLEKLVDTTDEWITERTGVRERRMVTTETSSDLGCRAVQSALKKRGLSADDIDCLIVCTVTPEYLFPATAILILDKLGAKSKWGFDLSAACSGFLFGLHTAYGLVRGGTAKRVVLVGVDIMSSIIDFQDRTTCVIFGDGAGAVIVEPTESPSGIIDSICRSQAAPELLYMPAGGSRRPPSIETVQNREHFIRQQGREVYKHAVLRMTEVSEEVLQRNGIPKSELKYFIPHQANLRIMDVVAKRLGLPMDRVGVNLDRYGNTTAATIPTCLCESLENGKIRKGDLVLFAAFGAGFTWGSTLMRW